MSPVRSPTFGDDEDCSASSLSAPDGRSDSVAEAGKLPCL